MSTMFTNIYYERRSGKMYLREVHNGTTVKVNEDNEFYFFQQTDKETEWSDAYGMPVVRKNFSNFREMRSAKDNAHARGLKTCETDMAEETKFLQNRFQGVEFDVDMTSVNTCYMDIEIAGELEFPEPSEARYPINLITVKDSKTNSITTFGLDRYNGDFKDPKFTYHYIQDEVSLLNRFIDWFRKQKFDTITGWNVRDFDIHYIVNRCRRLGVEKHLSPFNKEVEKYDKDKENDMTGSDHKMISGKSQYYQLPGINILDYMELYKNFTFVTRESYSLQYIGVTELKEGKLELDGQINHIYKTNWNLFTEYNIQDVLLVEKLEQKMKFIELAYILAHQSLIPVERIYSSIAVWDGYIMNDLRKTKQVMPDREEVEDWYIQEGHHILPSGKMINFKEGTKEVELTYVKGGHVEAYPGFYKWVISRDFASLYPHIIMQYNISPECLVVLPTKEEIAEGNLIKSTMPGIYFLPQSKKVGVMPTITKKIYEERVQFKGLMNEARDAGDKAKQAYYKSQQHIRKILLNSLYGVSCNAGFHFFNLENARSITRGGRVLIRHVSKYANDYFTSDDWNKEDRFEFYPNSDKEVNIKKPLVTMIDTDSNYLGVEELHNQCNPEQDPLEFCLEFNKNVFDPFFETCLEIYAEEHNAPQVHNFEIEKIIEKQLVQAKKKNITLVKWDEGEIYENPEIKVTGIEIKKSDTPKFCRTHLQNVVAMIFDEKGPEEITDEIIRIKKDYKKQDINEIAITKSVNKYKDYSLPTEEYLANGLTYMPKTPMAVRASINHNYLVKKWELPLFEIQKGAKPKYIYIKDRNILSQDVIAFIGSYPEEFEKHFVIDYDATFETSFLRIVQRFFTAIGWGEISLKKTNIKKFVY